MLSEFAKTLTGKFDVYKELICIMYRINFQVRVSEILTKISFVIFDIVVKKLIGCGLLWCLLLKTTRARHYSFP